MVKQLLFSVTKRDLEITWFSGRGAGGQHRNKNQNCCRIKHPDSGVIVTGQAQRSRVQNQRDAFRRLTNHPQFKKWLRIKASMSETERTEIERQVDEAMRPENLLIEAGDG